jgi:hypothetical protein
MAVGFGMNGKLIADFATYVDFYDLLMSVDKILPSNEDHSVVNFIKDGLIIETLRTSSFFGSLLCSKPDILEIYRHPNQEQLTKNAKVGPGYLYDENGEFKLPYEGWDTEIVDGMYNADREYYLLEFYTGD